MKTNSVRKMSLPFLAIKCGGFIVFLFLHVNRLLLPKIWKKYIQINRITSFSYRFLFNHM